MSRKLFTTIAATTVLICATGLCLAATHTTDPLTGLPLDPATDSMHIGNDPQPLTEMQICKSKMQANVYSAVKSKQSETVAWYAAHLQGFHKVHAYFDNRSQDKFYNDAGTIVVIVLGERGKEGVDVNTYSIAYYKMQPGLSAATIASFGTHETICK